MVLRPIDLNRPFDMSDALRSSQGISIKGLFFQEYVKEMQALGAPWPRHFVAFKSYPSSEFVSILTALIEKRYPGKPARAALQEVAACQYPVLRESLIGKVVFGVLGNNVSAVMRTAAKGYSIASEELGPVVVRDVSDGRALIEMSKQTLPLEGWHSGVFAGAIAAMGRRTTGLSVELRDEFNGLLEVQWG